MEKVDLSILPENLRKQVVFLSNEPAWRKDFAKQVIESLSKLGFAVLGIELWMPEGDVPRVIGWSEYNIEYSGDWGDYVQKNLEFAMRDIERVTEENVLFNLTWVSPNEVEDNRKLPQS